MAHKLSFRVHALRRMFDRRISVEDVRAVLDSGETIEQYPADQPYPSRLVLGWVQSHPLHVVVAENIRENQLIVVTAYEPDAALWEADFRRRKV